MTPLDLIEELGRPAAQDVKLTPSDIVAIDVYLASRSFLQGFCISQPDFKLAQAIEKQQQQDGGCFSLSEFSHLGRWLKHVGSYSRFGSQVGVKSGPVEVEKVVKGIRGMVKVPVWLCSVLRDTVLLIISRGTKLPTRFLIPHD